MSVHGEFQRCLADWAAFLQGCGAPGAIEWASRLEAAGTLGRDDLPAGAERVLELWEARANDGPDFPSDLLREESERLGDHLIGICEIVLGRPAR